jgi:hypothetical protein
VYSFCLRQASHCVSLTRRATSVTMRLGWSTDFLHSRSAIGSRLRSANGPKWNASWKMRVLCADRLKNEPFATVCFPTNQNLTSVWQ